MQDIINQLNQTNTYASYVQTDTNTIVATWNKNAQASGALGSTEVHFDYQVIVTLNPTDATYAYIEKMQSQNASTGVGANNIGLSANPFDNNNASNSGNGKVRLFSSSTESFQGKTFGSKQIGFTHQFGGKPGSDTITYNFDAEKVKQPLLAALQNAGYHEQKKSFFKKLFGQ
jgi:hypothetical protein